jgi:hypothetical protein
MLNSLYNHLDQISVSYGHVNVEFGDPATLELHKFRLLASIDPQLLSFSQGYSRRVLGCQICRLTLPDSLHIQITKAQASRQSKTTGIRAPWKR